MYLRPHNSIYNLVHLQHHPATFVPFVFVKIATRSGKTNIVGWKMDPDWRYVFLFQLVVSTHLKNKLVKLKYFPQGSGQNKKTLKTTT